MKFRTQYDDDMRKPKEGIVFEKPSRTVQSEADMCDLNRIMDKYALPEAFAFARSVPETREAMYGDFSTLEDYQTSIAVVRKAEEDFANMPSNIRAYFDNNPANMLQFLQEPEKNYEEGVRLGLFKSREFNDSSSDSSSSVVNIGGSSTSGSDN